MNKVQDKNCKYIPNIQIVYTTSFRFLTRNKIKFWENIISNN